MLRFFVGLHRPSSDVEPYAQTHKSIVPARHRSLCGRGIRYVRAVSRLCGEGRGATDLLDRPYSCGTIVWSDGKSSRGDYRRFHFCGVLI